MIIEENERERLSYGKIKEILSSTDGGILIESSKECPICMENNCDRILVCGHIFCSKC